MANVITCIRIICSLTLIFCPTFSTWFYAFYIVCGISDILDGFVARHFGKETKLGAKLDTIADFIFFVVVITKFVRAIYIPIWLTVWIVFIASIKSIGIFSGFVIYKRFITEHTVMNKICGVLLFAIPLYIGQFPWETVVVFIILTCCVATFSAIQEEHYIRIGKEIG